MYKPATSTTKNLSLAIALLTAMVVLLLAQGCANEVAPKKKLLVLAAADLKKPFEEMKPLFERKTGARVTYSFGSTGQLAMGVEAGGKADVFAAANIKYVDDLREKDLVYPDTQQLYAVGRLTVWSRKDARLHPLRIEDLASPKIFKIAIANPEHAPYGVAAKEAMFKVGVWPKVKDRLVLGENAAQTLQFVQSGNVDAGIVPLSLATGSDGTWKLVPSELHNPLKQSIAVLKATSDKQLGESFIKFINGPEGRPIMKKYGFTLPSELKE